jgi:uncharacterized membrane protein
MGQITIHKTIDAPVDAVFAYVDDYKNTTKYMKGLTKWKPTGKETHGKGAQFEVAMKAGPSTLASVVDITTWTENGAIGWVSRSGFKQSGKWSFHNKAGKTDVTFDMSYEFGGGIAGKLIGKAAEPIVRLNLQQSVNALKSQAEKTKPKAETKPSTARAHSAPPAARAKPTAAKKTSTKKTADRSKTSSTR